MHKCFHSVKRTSLAFHFVFTTSNETFVLLPLYFQNVGSFSHEKHKVIYFDVLVFTLSYFVSVSYIRVFVREKIKNYHNTDKKTTVVIF